MSNESIEIGRLWLQLKRIADAMVPQLREPFVNLPGLRGYWPMSVVDFLGNAKDHSGASSDLSGSGSPTFGYDGNAFVQTGVGTDYLSGSISAQAVTGVETWISAGIRGMTVGCWLNVDVLPTATEGLISRWYGTPNRSYGLVLTSLGEARFQVSSDGSAAELVTGQALGTSTWVFMVGRFTPGQEIAIFVNSTKIVNTTSIPASLHVGSAVFEVGRLNGNNVNIFEGKMRDAFLCQTILTDDQIESLRLASLPAT